MYEIMKKLIEKGYYLNGEEAQQKLDVFFATNRINAEQYTELTTMIESKNQNNLE